MSNIFDSIDSRLVTGVVRQDRREPSFEVDTLSCEPFAHQKIIASTGGLYLVRGTGRAAGGPETRWSVVLKVVDRPGDTASVGDWDDPAAWLYWKREPLAFQSGMLDGLPPGMRAPRCYGIVDRPESAWIWMEHVEESRGRRWSAEQFHRAVRSVGRFGSAYLCGTRMPESPWLCPSFFRSLHGEGGWWALHTDPDSPQSVWGNERVVQGFGDNLRRRILTTWRERDVLFEAIEKLPVVLCHNDLHRRNLLWRASGGAEELVALDWGFCGPGAAGMDMGELIANSTYFFESDPERIGDLEAVVLDGYQAGLRDGGWNGDPQAVRLGYLISSVLWMGVTLPGWTAHFLGADSSAEAELAFGRPAAQVLSGWVTLSEFLMERADMLRSLLRSAR